MTDAPNTVTIPCPECEAAGVTKLFTGNATGRGTASWKLSLHRAQAHKVDGDPANKPEARGRKPRPNRGEIDTETHPGLTIVRGMTDEIPQGRGAPSREQLGAALGKGLGLVSLSVASWAAETDPRPLTDAQRDQITAELILPANPAREVMDPFARAIAGTTFNRKYGRVIVENVDLASAFAELAKVGIRYKRYFAERDRWVKSNGAPAPIAAVRSPMATDVAEVMHPGEPVGSEGIVWTPDMVKAMNGAAP